MTKKDELAQVLAALEPEIDELPGDLPMIAKIIEKFAPGKGVEIVMALAEANSGTYVLFHTTKKLKQKARDRWIVEQFDNGATAPELARAAGIGERQVWNILGKEPVDERQLSLF